MSIVKSSIKKIFSLLRLEVRRIPKEIILLPSSSFTLKISKLEKLNLIFLLVTPMQIIGMINGIQIYYKMN